MPRKKITIQPRESQKNYMDEFQSLTESTEFKEKIVRKSFTISEELNKKVEQYIYRKRTTGDIYYSQTCLIREALEDFFSSRNTEK